MGFHADVRAAGVQLLKDYAADAAVKLQAYPGRPASLFPPSAFVDRLSETVTLVGHNRQRTVRASLVVVHGLFDSADAAAKKDAFADGFMDWVSERYHAAGDNTLVAVVACEDLPAWVPDWMAPEKQRTYYATELTLEGYAED